MPQHPGPLQDKDLVEMNTRLEELAEAETLIQQAIRGGIDVKEQQKRVKELRDQLLRMKQSFFPGQ